MLSLSKLTRTTVLGLAIACLTLPVRAADLDKIVPADSEGAVVFNFKSLFESKLFQKYGEEPLKAAMKDEKAAKVIESTGLDPLKDITSVTVTFSGAAGGRETMKFAMIVKGNFDVPKLEAAIGDAVKKQTGEAPKSEKEGDQTYWTFKNPQGEDITATFVGKEGLIASNNPSYLKNIVAGKGIDTTASGKSLKTAVGKVGGKETMFAAAAITEQIKGLMGMNPQLKDLAPKLDAISGSVNIAEAIDVVLSVHTTDADTAKSLGQLIKQVLPLAKLFGAQNEMAKPIIDALVDNLKVGSDGTMVNLKLQLTEELMKKLQPGGN